MPQQRLTVTDNESGDKVTFMWHGAEPPTEQDIEQVFAQARQGQQEQGGPSFSPTRFGQEFKETLLDPLATISSDVITGVTGAGQGPISRPADEARRRLGSIPGNILQEGGNLFLQGVDRIGQALSPGGPTPGAELTPRTREIAQREGIPMSDEQPVTAGQRVGTAVEGVSDMIGGAVPVVGPIAHRAGELAGEGDIGGAAGVTAGLFAPQAVGGALSRMKPSVAQRGAIDFELPSGRKVEVPTTRGETGGTVARTVERVARGSELANPPFRRFDARRTDILIDDISNQIVREVSKEAQGASTPAVGASFQRNLRKGQEALKSAGGEQLNAAEAAAVNAGVQVQPTRFRTFMRQELKERQAAMKAAKLRGDAAAVAELRNAAADTQAALLDGIPPELQSRYAAALGESGVQAVEAIPAQAAFPLLKNARFNARRVPGQNPGVQGGVLKQGAKLLAEDIEASLRAADPQLARQWRVANSMYRRATQRLEDATFQKVFKANSEAVPQVLEQVDVRQIPRLKAAVPPGKFEATAAKLLELDLNRAIRGEHPSSFQSGPFAQQRSIRADPMRNFVEKMEEGGRGRAIFGDAHMRSLHDLANVLDRVKESTGVGSGVSIIGAAIDAAATVRLGTGALAGVLGGALLGAPVGGGMLGATAALSAPAALRLAAHILVKPKGASLLKNVVRATGKPIQYTQAAARLGEFIQDDPELKQMLEQSAPRQGTVPMEQLRPEGGQ